MKMIKVNIKTLYLILNVFAYILLDSEVELKPESYVQFYSATNNTTTTAVATSSNGSA